MKVQGWCLTCAGLVLDERTLVPGQRLLEGLREVEEAPADDDIVVEGHEEAHLQPEIKKHLFRCRNQTTLCWQSV